ncbi:hypothetical protein V2J09_007097 [Rumex salicifolius]
MISNHFQSLYNVEVVPGLIDLPRGRFPPLQDVQQHDLAASFTVQDVRNALFAMHPLKASGPMDTMNWEIVRAEVEKEVLFVLNGGIIQEALNDTLLVCIPKVDNPVSVNQLRPLILYNVAFKVITKAIASRLKDIMKMVVAPTQASFISDSQISDNIAIIKEVMHYMQDGNWFCEASGSKINYQKSKVCFSKSANERIAEQISAAGNIPTAEDLGRYLGVNLNKKKASRNQYRHIVDKVNNRLNGWKARYLSIAGRFTLVKSVIEFVPYFAMQTSSLPLTICDEVEQKGRSFIWGSTKEKRKVHLLNKDKMKRLQTKGGLGMRSMRQANCAFMAKIG